MIVSVPKDLQLKLLEGLTAISNRVDDSRVPESAGIRPAARIGSGCARTIDIAVGYGRYTCEGREGRKRTVVAVSR